MKKHLMYLIHAAVILAAVVLIVVSSSMAYPLTDLTLIIALGAAAIALDLIMIFVFKEDGIVRDILMMGTVVLAALCLCRVLAGRADLMGYVWFSDLEKGNPTAVTSLNLAAASMGGFLLGVLISIVSGFRKNA